MVSITRFKYKSGSLVTCLDDVKSKLLLDFVESLSFREVKNFKSIHSNRRNEVFSLSLDGLGGRMIMKHTRSTHPILHRRISFRIRNWLRDYSGCSFWGALRLQKVGVRSVEPIAYWTYRHGPFQTETYFLYYEAPSVNTVENLYNSENTSDRLFAKEKLLPVMAEMTSRLHRARLLHGDITTHNFLVSEANPLELVLIDVDHVRRNQFSIPLLRTVKELYCLRRLDISAADRVEFLKRYLGDRFNNTNYNIFRFWYWFADTKRKELDKASRRQLVRELRNRVPA